jgi:glycosyltransferase involved in cell wall biosynthesis
MGSQSKFKLTYVTFDSLYEGVGASQVLAYLKLLALNFDITLINFEKGTPGQDFLSQMENSGIQWIALPFGKNGALGGVGRILKMRSKIPTGSLVHARSDLAAFASLLRPSAKVIWDCRALVADQRRAIASQKRMTFQYLALRAIEFIVARQSKAVIVITNSVIPILMKRHHLKSDKFHMISTCVNLHNFKPEDIPHEGPLRVMISGTLSGAYDFETMFRLIESLKKLTPVHVFAALSKGHTDSWKNLPIDEIVSVPHSQMPELVRRMDLGLSVWKMDLGVCLASVSSTKVPEFLASGVPVVVNFNQGDIGRLVEENSCGIAIHDNSELSIEIAAKQILQLRAEGGTPTRCRKLATANFSLDDAVVKLGELYKSI